MKRTAKKSSAKKAVAPKKAMPKPKTLKASKVAGKEKDARLALKLTVSTGGAALTPEQQKDVALHQEMLAAWTSGTLWKDIIAKTGWKSGRSHLVKAAGGEEGFKKAQVERNALLVTQGRHPFVKRTVQSA